MMLLLIVLCILYVSSSHVEILVYTHNNTMETIECYEYYGIIDKEFSRYILAEETSLMTIDSYNISVGNCSFIYGDCDEMLKIDWRRDDIFEIEHYGFNNDPCWNGIVIHTGRGLGEFYFY